MAVYAQENGQGMVFEAESLDEREEVEEPEAHTPDEDPPQPPQKPGRSHLKVVK